MGSPRHPAPLAHRRRHQYGNLPGMAKDGPRTKEANLTTEAQERNLFDTQSHTCLKMSTQRDEPPSANSPAPHSHHDDLSGTRYLHRPSAYPSHLIAYGIPLATQGPALIVVKSTTRSGTSPVTVASTCGHGVPTSRICRYAQVLI